MTCFLCVSARRNTPADADSRPKRPCGPSASVWLRLPGARRIRSTSSSARLRLWHVKTPAPYLHLQGGASIHPSPTVLHHTITLSLCLQQGEENSNKLVFIFLLFLNLSLPPLKLPWRTQFLFCCQTKGLNHRFNFLTFRIDYINFSYVYFIWMGNGLCTMGGLVCGKSWSSPKQEKKTTQTHKGLLWSIWFALCSEKK